MNSRIISKIELDDALLQKDIETILNFEDVKEEYSEYRFGTWKNYVLRNGTGNQADTLFVGTAGGGIETPLGARLKYLSSVIEENFHTDKLRMVRANLLQDAVLIPHRDYVEFKSDCRRLARIHIPIKTDERSLHSEGKEVFHMRRGEVWYLDVSNIHSACNLSETPRISLVLDFCLDSEPLETALKNPPQHDPELQPMIIERGPLDDSLLTTIASMKHIINHGNYRDIVFFLSRVHFYKDVSLGIFFDWLIGICENAEDKSLLEKSLNFKEYMMNDRELAQRFSL